MTVDGKNSEWEDTVKRGTLLSSEASKNNRPIHGRFLRYASRVNTWRKETVCSAHFLHLHVNQGIYCCSTLPFNKGKIPVYSAIPGITDSTHISNVVIIAIVSNLLQRRSKGKVLKTLKIA